MSVPTAIATWEFGRPAVVCSGEVLASGGAALDAVESGIRLVELDPDVTSVGYGGLPNDEGVVQLDAEIMDGATLDAGAVACLEGFRGPITIARRVMQASQHVFLVGEGTAGFARRHGFEEETTLTPTAHDEWLAWRCQESDAQAHDTICLLPLDSNGDMAAGCATSGFAFKESGRIGDSPLLGAGLYVDGDVGGASATGLGESIMKFSLSFLVVELMRHGLTPDGACREAIGRMIGKGRAFAADIALDRHGAHAGYATRQGFSYAAWTPAGLSYTEVDVPL